MKHNKKRNTAFLYESLVKEMTKAALHSDTNAKNLIASILREHFHTSSVLHKELNLYKTLCEVRNVERRTAEKILTEVKRVYHNLGEEEIFDEQSRVIKKINTSLSKKVYSNFISNYKTLATISQMFSSKTPITKKVILEDSLVEQMTKASDERQVMRPIDNITYKMFVQKFNDKYGSTLNEHQKYLLSRYVTLSPENAVEFKLYVNDEIARLKEVVKSLQSRKEVLLDESLSHKNREVLAVLESFKKQRINDDMIRKILKMQALAVEA
jgi:hypothetical protein